DNISDKAQMPEQKEAAQIAGMLEGAFNENLFLERGIELESIARTIGAEFTKYANNPNSYVDSDDE
ncbi:hypothetical protein CVN76_01990, partial [Bacillus sp. mrc49]